MNKKAKTKAVKISQEHVDEMFKFREFEKKYMCRYCLHRVDDLNAIRKHIITHLSSMSGGLKFKIELEVEKEEETEDSKK